MTIQIRAQINGGAQQTGAVTVTSADVVQLSLVSSAGLGSLLWEIFSRPTNEAGSGYQLPLPSGWTLGADGHSYFYVGTTPPTVTIPGAPYWGKILVRCTPGGDALAADDSLVLTMLSPTLGLEDIAPLEESQANAYRAWGKAIQNDLRIMEDAIAGAGAGTPYASTPANVTTAGAAGASSNYARGDHAHRGVASLAKSGSAALYGAVTLTGGSNVTLTQAGNNIEIAASGGGGPPAAITWDTANVTNSATGTYQTWAEIRTLANSTTAPLAVLGKGAPTTSGTSTDSWPHVTFKSDDAAVTFTFTEGVVVKYARFDVAGIVTSTATTTTNLKYAPGSKTTLRGQFSAGTKGLIGLDGAGTAEVRLADGSLVSTYAFHTAAGETLNIHTGATEWEAGAVDHFEGSAGTVNVYRSNDTVGLPELSAYAGTYTKLSTPYVGAIAPTPDGVHDLVVLRLNELYGATSAANSGAGTAFTLGTTSGTGSVTFGQPVPFGTGLLMIDRAYLEGSGAALTYQPSTQDFTVQVWVKQLAEYTGAPGDNITFFAKPVVGGATFGLYVDKGTGEAGAIVKTSGGQVQVAGPRVPMSEWTHIAATYDGANLTVYVNGVAGTPTAHTGTLVWDNSYSFLVGNMDPAVSGGYIVSEAWFSDVARSRAEIVSIYQGGAYNGAIGVLDAQSLNGVDIDPTPPVDGLVMTASGAGAAAWETPRLIRSNVDMVAAFPTSGTNALDAEVGQIIGVMKPSDALGIRLRWGSASGTPTATVTLYDSGGAVLGTADQVVSTTPTTYDVLFASPVDLSGYLFEDLIVSVWEHNGGTPTGNYYSAITANFATQATPLPAGEGIETRGSIYVSPGGSVPTTTTGIEVYGVDLIRRFRLCLRSST